MLESVHFNASMFMAGLVRAFEYKVFVDAAYGRVPMAAANVEMESNASSSLVWSSNESET